MLDEHPTPAQIRCITRFAIILHDQTHMEESPKTRREARDMIYELRALLKKYNLDKINRRK